MSLIVPAPAKLPFRLENLDSYLSSHADFGISTNGSTTTLVDSSKTWDVDRWTGYLLMIMSGRGAGQTRVITSNTANTLTMANAFAVAIAAGALYKITGFNFLAESGTDVNLRVSLYNAANQILAVSAPGDNGVSASYALLVYNQNALFNGTAWDKVRNNVEATVFASAARTTTTNSADQTNFNRRGARFFLSVTAASGTTPTLNVKIQTKDSIAGDYVDLPGAAFTEKTGVTNDELTVYPGIAETANETVSDVLSRTWRAVATIAGTTPSFTFSLSVAYV